MNEKILQAIADALARPVRALPGCVGLSIALPKGGVRAQLALRAETNTGARHLATAVGLQLQQRTTADGWYLTAEGETPTLRVLVNGPYHATQRRNLDETRLAEALTAIDEVSNKISGEITPTSNESCPDPAKTDTSKPFERRKRSKGSP